MTLLDTIDISTELCGIKFPSCIMNAAGIRDTTLEELIALKESKSGAIVTKSLTKESRTGNLKPRYFNFGLGSINSTGLENPGVMKANEILYELEYKGAYLGYNKPLIVSLAASHFLDYILMINHLKDLKIDMFELDVSCPNILGNKNLQAYDFFQLENICSSVMSYVKYNFKTKIGLKLPPYFTDCQFEKVAQISKPYNIDFITVINSVPNGLVVDPATETTVIKPNKGFGGLGGSCIKPIALANVRKFYRLLDIPIIGVGGISNGIDVFEHILCGASAVQLGTVLQEKSTAYFNLLENHLEMIMEQKGYKSINEFKGKLKEL